MTEDKPVPSPLPASHARFVPAGEDRDGRFRGLGVSSIACKVTPRDPELRRAHCTALAGPPLEGFEP